MDLLDKLGGWLIFFAITCMWIYLTIKDYRDLNYYEKSIVLIGKNGLIIIDNVLWHGEVADNSKNDKFTNIIREFNKYIKDDNRVIKNIIPIGDGLTICIKK